MKNHWSIQLEILEQGDIYFFYKPKKNIKKVEGPDDIGRFYMVMDPGKNYPHRFVVLGPKRLPKTGDGHRKGWGFVEKIGGRGYRVLPQNSEVTLSRGQARPAGEGLYAIILHHDHTHFVYSLELPNRRGEVQKELNIKREGNYLMLVKTTTSENTDPSLIRYIPANPPTLLNNERAQVLLIGIGEEVSSLGLQVNKDKETLQTADIFHELKLNSARHPIAPLIKGEWV